MNTGHNNYMFIDWDGVCKTKLYKAGKHYDTIITDKESDDGYRQHLARTPMLYNPDEVVPGIPHGGTREGEMSSCSKAVYLRRKREKEKLLK